MDLITPDQCGDDARLRMLRLGQDRLAASREAVVAMASGGCARYAFSMTASFCLDRHGRPLMLYASNNPHHHLILTNSTMEFRLVLEESADGDELSLLVLTGMLALVDPGDHDSLDRHTRYFDGHPENYSRGHARLYRFQPHTAAVELISGERVPLPVEDLTSRNLFSSAQELDLIQFSHACLGRLPPGSGLEGAHIAGVDPRGADVRVAGRIRRFPFSTPAASVHQAELAITALHRISDLDD